MKQKYLAAKSYIILFTLLVSFWSSSLADGGGGDDLHEPYQEDGAYKNTPDHQEQAGFYIDPGIGIGSFKLGMTRQQVAALMSYHYAVRQHSHGITEIDGRYKSALHGWDACMQVLLEAISKSSE